MLRGRPAPCLPSALELIASQTTSPLAVASLPYAFSEPCVWLRLTNGQSALNHSRTTIFPLSEERSVSVSVKSGAGLPSSAAAPAASAAFGASAFAGAVTF